MYASYHHPIPWPISLNNQHASHHASIMYHHTPHPSSIFYLFISSFIHSWLCACGTGYICMLAGASSIGHFRPISGDADGASSSPKDVRGIEHKPRRRFFFLSSSRNTERTGESLTVTKREREGVHNENFCCKGGGVLVVEWG
jgi:hypothetical protein